ncbi:MAG TPA: CpsD/CapB family tyrosine-protein kinase [Albidovulum sp.]|uniref:CpsD/CapB family tyrosine-protein kinase n=1 Tax=Albidovulum sp. TaxID=1872424 RepID=UPI002CC3288F|nr:CpsD/CapB family tyrosine-protein kinase [Albidovulum sp.]
MEKLEAALAKAREMRQGALGGPEAPPRSATAKAAAPVSPTWQSLPEVALPEGHAQRYRISALSGGRDAAPYDMLRSRIIRMMKEKGWSRLAVTSPEAGCGKSTVSLNLALSLARQSDLKVMLLDLDLRRPSLHRTLGYNPAKSLHEYLDGSAEFDQCAVRMGENLIVALNVSSSRRPSELLQSQASRDALDAAERRWRPDVVIFDMSPMLASDDNVGFLGNVDCALLIAAAESTTIPNIDICEKEIAQLTNVLGVVLNKCRYADDSVGYDYGTYQ